MDRVTQQNAALVEQSAAAAESLRQQAQQLVSAVAVFKLGNEGQANGAAANAVVPAVKRHTPITKPAAAAPASLPASAVQVERRGPNRATNVTRPDFSSRKPAATTPSPAATPEPAARTGTTDEWESF
jgi:methyl-accepting chemotaxis protein